MIFPQNSEAVTKTNSSSLSQLGSMRQEANGQNENGGIGGWLSEKITSSFQSLFKLKKETGKNLNPGESPQSNLGLKAVDFLKSKMHNLVHKNLMYA